LARRQPIPSACAGIELGGQTEGGGCARSVDGGRNMVVKRVEVRGREIEHELSGASGLACGTENRAVRAQFSAWATKTKVWGAWRLWWVGCMLSLRWWAHTVSREPADKHN
jgi:hypothetical protein